MSKIEVLEGADAFTLEGGSTGALLVHGFTGSPQGMLALGQHLNQAGVTVVAPRLPGHGTSWEDLGTRTHEDWSGAVEEAFDDLVARCDEVFVVGLSFGASLSIDLAARRRGRVAGLVLLASYVITKDPRRFFAPAIRFVLQSLPGVANDIADPEMREIAYDRIPTKAAYSMLQFTRRARRALPSVTCPTLIIHSRNDHTAHPDNAQVIYDELGTTDKEIVWLERSYHVITVDLEREQVYERTLAFIKENARHGL
ncbi:MAG: alpha/beta fold hydrolase [Actinomycetota bacterium]|nr:alpha/beta fold hydrolase [Actinomycetota bacterium]